MALFREHISFGAVIAALGVVFLYFYAIITDPLLLIILFVATTVAAFLPDLDSDSGVPFYTVFGIFTLACGGGVLYYFLANPPENLYILIGAPIGVMLFVWFVVGTIFKRFTRHRGIMHSVPVMIIAGLLTYLAARYLEQNDTVALIFALATAVGYASHLILDEIHSENLVDGNPFVNKNSLGTALKLFSKSKSVNLFTYGLLAVLVYTALQ